VNVAGAVAIIGVSIRPGITALTRMPRSPNSSDAALVRPRKAHLLAVYAAAACPDTAATEHTFTMLDPGGINGTNAWMPSIGPVTLMSKARCHPSRDTCGSRSRAATPALFTSASTRSSDAASDAQPPSSVTSSTRPSAKGSTSVAMTTAPSARSAATSAAPCPRAAPVTTTTFPASRPLIPAPTRRRRPPGARR
jgi:hypothetical protein